MDGASYNHFLPPKPETFDPENSSFVQFISSFNNYCEWNNIPGDMKPLLFSSYLKTKAFLYYNNLPAETKSNYDKLLVHLPEDTNPILNKSLRI